MIYSKQSSPLKELGWKITRAISRLFILAAVCQPAFADETAAAGGDDMLGNIPEQTANEPAAIADASKKEGEPCKITHAAEAFYETKNNITRCRVTTCEDKYKPDTLRSQCVLDIAGIPTEKSTAIPNPALEKCMDAIKEIVHKENPEHKFASNMKGFCDDPENRTNEKQKAFAQRLIEDAKKNAESAAAQAANDNDAKIKFLAEEFKRDSEPVIAQIDKAPDKDKPALYKKYQDMRTKFIKELGDLDVSVS